MISPSLVIVLHNVRSSHNVGAVLRTCDGVGVTECLLGGYTPSPSDRFKRPNKELLKTALGAEKSVSWRSVQDISAEIKIFKKAGYHVVACELAQNAIPYTRIPMHEKYVCIVGNEVDGLPQDICDAADTVAYIPMRGGKESLNVSSAAAVMLYHLRDRVT